MADIDQTMGSNPFLGDRPTRWIEVADAQGNKAWVQGVAVLDSAAADGVTRQAGNEDLLEVLCGVREELRAIRLHFDIFHGDLGDTTDG